MTYASKIAMNVRGEWLEIPVPNEADERWREGQSLYERLQALNARWVLLTHNTDHAWRAVPPDTNICFRAYLPKALPIDNDMNLVDSLTPIEAIDHLVAENDLPERAYLHLVNEPIQRDRWGDLVTWLITAAEYAWSQYHRRTVLGNFSVGWPEPDEWANTPLADLLRYCAFSPETCVLGLHEYGTTDIVGSSPWLVGRFKFALAACDQLSIPRPRILITEFGVGLKPSFESTTWQDAGMTQEAYAAWCIAALEMHYLDAPEVEGVLLFEYAGGDPYEYKGHDVEWAHTFWNRIIADAQGRIEVPPPVTEPSGCWPSFLRPFGSIGG